MWSNQQFRDYSEQLKNLWERQISPWKYAPGITRSSPSPFYADLLSSSRSSYTINQNNLNWLVLSAVQARVSTSDFLWGVSRDAERWREDQSRFCKSLLTGRHCCRPSSKLYMFAVQDFLIGNETKGSARWCKKKKKKESTFTRLT